MQSPIQPSACTAVKIECISHWVDVPLSATIPNTFSWLMAEVRISYKRLLVAAAWPTTAMRAAPTGHNQVNGMLLGSSSK